MKDKLGCAGVIVYFVLGIFQFVAAYKGVQIWFEGPWILTTAITLIAAYIPILGTVVGIKGAMAAWGWGLWPSIAFFCWPFGVVLLAAIVGGVVILFSRNE